MARVKRGTINHRKHKSFLKKAKGFRLGRKKLYKQAKEASLRAGQHAYAHRRTKKRAFRRLWIVRLNAAARKHGLKYGELIKGLKKNKINLDRKVLADLAVKEPEVFQKIVETIKK